MWLVIIDRYFKIWVVCILVLFPIMNAISQEGGQGTPEGTNEREGDQEYIEEGMQKGKGTPEGQSECVITDDVLLTQELSGDGVFIQENTIYYSPGKPITVKVTLTKQASEQILALGLESLFPGGWQFQGVSSGIAPAVYPVSDKVVSNGIDPFEFAWISIPSFPFSFSFTVNVPSNMEGPCQISTQALFRMSGPQYCSNIARTSFAGTVPLQEGEGNQEGTVEGIIEGSEEGIPEGTVEGAIEGNKEGTPEGTPEGSPDGEGTGSMTAEELQSVLKTRFAELDTNGDGVISWEEASNAYPNLSRDVFNQLDSDGDGVITKTEVGIKEKPKGICGLFTRIFSEEKMWQKSFLDLLLIGILITTLLGMKKGHNYSK